MRSPPPSVEFVCTLEELLARPFHGAVNALCWSRTLPGDFGEIARALAPQEGLRELAEAELRALELSPEGRLAANAMLEDHARLEALGLAPVLNCITAYPRDERGLAISTDVHSFHVDSAPHEVDTWLCTYEGLPSEGLANGEAQRLVDLPDLRVRLGDAEDEGFQLHYAPLDGAQPFSFGVGHLWRIAVKWPGSPVLPCIHRAPVGGGPRLVLIS